MSKDKHEHYHEANDSLGCAAIILAFAVLIAVLAHYGLIG